MTLKLSMENYQKIIEDIYLDLKNIDDVGKVANYIPELGEVSADKFGINMTTIDNKSFDVGNANEKFSIQSISKILTLTLAYKLEGEKLWERLDVEPSGNLEIKTKNNSIDWSDAQLIKWRIIEPKDSLKIIKI